MITSSRVRKAADKHSCPYMMTNLVAVKEEVGDSERDEDSGRDEDSEWDED